MRKSGQVPAYRSGRALRQEIESTVVPAGLVALWNIGQVGTVIKTPVMADGKAKIIAIDPYLTRAIEVNSPGTEFVREYNPPLNPESLSICDAIFITHHHDDHLDLSTLISTHQANPKVRFIVPAPHVHLLIEGGVSRDVITPAVDGQTIEIAGIDVLSIAAAHTEYETDDDGNQIFVGYVFTLIQGDAQDAIRIYHSGDTVITDKLIEQLKPIQPHIALLPINGGDYFRTERNIIGNMNAREAVQFAHTIGVDLLIPNHYDMFPNNRDNPAHFVDYLFHEYPDLKFHMLSVGERLLYMA